MKIMFSLDLPLSNGDKKRVHIGHPYSQEEKNRMYSFRYEQYLRHGYFKKSLEKNPLDIDEYDDGRSVYFIALVDEKIVGTVRLIQDQYLPTEKDCFDFEEPKKISKIDRPHRAEIGRLIVVPYDVGQFFPRHVIMLGLLMAIVKYCKKNNLEGGYSFVKDALRKKIDHLNMPVYVIKTFEQKYTGRYLKMYFQDKNNPVWPVYYITDEMYNYLKSVFWAYFIQVGQKTYQYNPSIVRKLLLRIRFLFPW